MRFSFPVLFLALVLVGTTQSFAADGEDDLSFVVTAGRTAEDAASVPAQVTVITSDDIAASGASNLVEVLEQVPGVRFTGATAGPGSEAVSMRGFGENSHGRVLVLVDGRRLNNPDMQGINWNAVPLADIERIEVLDGAASVQYGNNAVGGVINIITKKSGGARTTVSLSAGSFASGRVRPGNREAFSHFSPAKWGNFSLTAEHSGTEGYRDRQAANIMNTGARGTIDLSENLSLTFNTSLAYLYYEMPGGLNKADYEKDPTKALSAYTSTPTWDDEISEYDVSGGLGLLWAINDTVSLEFPLSYTGKFIDTDTGSYSSYTSRHVHTGEARPQVQAALEIAGKPLRLLGGVDLYYAYLNNDVYSDHNKTNKTLRAATTEFSLGPYLTVRFDPIVNLTVTAGIRFDTAFVSAEETEIMPPLEGDKNWNAFVYNTGIAYRPLDSLKLYAAGATLFRYPFTDELAAFSGYADYFNPDLVPEKGFNVEGGVEFRLSDIFSVNANLYYTQLEDEVVYDQVLSHNVNLDKTRRIGTNAGLSVKPVRFLEIEGAYSFVDAIFIDGVNEDKHIPLVPAHTFYGTLTVKLPFGLQFGPTFEFRGESCQGGDTANALEKIEAYALYGAFLRYVLEKEGRNFSLQLTAKNLLDTRHTSNVYNDGYGTSTYYPGDGRSISLSAVFRL